MTDITDKEAESFVALLSEKPNKPRQPKLSVTDGMIESGCRGMYGQHWDGPPDKMPGEEMKNVWRKLSRKCLEAALASPNGDRA